jgi:hypothetical protein
MPVHGGSGWSSEAKTVYNVPKKTAFSQQTAVYTRIFKQNAPVNLENKLSN